LATSASANSLKCRNCLPHVLEANPDRDSRVGLTKSRIPPDRYPGM
jgi:hypothetical protein